MIITREDCLDNFEFWSGAQETWDAFDTYDQRAIEDALEMEYPNGIDETYLNDLFRFEEDYIASLAGYDDWDSFMETKKEDKDESEESEEDAENNE